VVSLNPDDLVGRVVNVEISHYTSKAGKVSAVVKKYLPATTPAAKAASGGRRPAAAQAMTEDTIPF
jgi:hypothetical protein